MESVQIAIGDNGFSICHIGHPIVGEGIIEGVQEFGIARELAEMLDGELADE